MEEKIMTVSLQNALIIKTNLTNEIHILRIAIDTAKAKQCLSLAKKLDQLLKETNQKMLELEDSFKVSNIQTTSSIFDEVVNLG
ncbi:MAG TPA: hypothetical protein PLX69_24875 [Leptospiraceae bacterium]|nr:hypothetical protein [Leptospiraceae bacterium]